MPQRPDPQTGPSPRWTLPRDPEPWTPLERRGLAAIVLVALAARVGYVLLLGDQPLDQLSDPRYYSLIAENLGSGHGYTELGARAYRPPGFVWFLSGIYAVAGIDVLAARLMLALVGAGHCLLQAAWVRRLATPRAGLVAAGLTAIYPQFIRYPQALFTEVLFMFLQALTLVLLLRALASDSWWRLAIAGAVCGLTALTRELGVIMLPAVGLWFLVARTALPAGLGRRWLVFAGACLLVILPWTVRNYRVLGAVVPISTSTGINLYIGNNPEATGQFTWTLAPGVEWNDGAGELAAHREGTRAAIAHVLAHPVATAGLALKKFWILWRPPVYGFGGLGAVGAALRAAYLLAYIVVLAAPLLGWRTLRGIWPAPALPLLLLGLTTAAHLASFAETRFRVPLEALVIALAAMVLVAWWPRWVSRRAAPRSPAGSTPGAS